MVTSSTLASSFETAFRLTPQALPGGGTGPEPQAEPASEPDAEPVFGMAPDAETASMLNGADLLATLDHRDLSAMLDSWPSAAFAVELLPDGGMHTITVNGRLRVLANTDGESAAEDEPDFLAAMLGPEAETYCRCCADSGQPLGWQARRRTGMGERIWRIAVGPVRDHEGVVIRLIGTVDDVTDLWRERTALRANEARLKAALEALDEGVAVRDRAGHLVFSNPAFDRLRSALTLTADSGREEHSAATEPPAERAFDPDARTERLGDGRTVAFRDHPCPDGGIVTIGCDVTVRQQGDWKARHSRAAGQALLDHVDALILTISRSGIVLTVNRFGAAWLGLTPDAVIGRRLAAVLQAAGVARAESELRRGDLPDAASLDTAAVDTDLSAVIAAARPCRRDLARHGRVLAACLQPIPGAFGAVSAVALIGRDVTDQRAWETEARASQAALIHCQRVAVMGEMAAAIAHELRQPLTSVIANGHAARSQLPADKTWHAVASAIDEVCRDAERAAAILQGIAAFVRRGAATRARVCINELVDRVTDLVRKDLERHGIALILDLADQLPVVVAHAVEIEQVVVNLVRNSTAALAQRPADERQVVIVTEAVAGDDGRARVRVAVEDTGPGFGPELQRLFTAFETTKPDGLGLGLVICRTIVEAHGGSIIAEVPHAGGARVSFVLPAGEAERERG
ncbi:MAG: hypothetical protein EA405_01305 [Rhodospirillales bacterium]|nr:MAG: hypothetical protein EA405_01305 [Rhodospirillales bacterium]